ncbi:hypothetical protein C9374_012629 [Naegleria lovaniensis]|uniref:Mannosyltransferase n=1 Tax=Naegleria lovaniensis TaxID=51637 RepID=A0AA88KQI4_NAELO|nr:uncharacterized protein C9374_012629 [Naegleria lovaniensis]KAG2392377.1 hypothetical protein C9374_012629 [Naegleria lovaniensis]
MFQRSSTRTSDTPSTRSAPSWFLLLSSLILFRLLSSLFTTTYFSADEYYQGIEIAHSLHFPQHPHIIPWEWQSEHALRGYLHPMILSVGYYLMDYIPQKINHESLLFNNLFNHLKGMEKDEEMQQHQMIWMGFLAWWLPRMVQAVLTAISDYFLYLICVKYFENWKIGIWCLIIACTNWFHIYCGVRTFSNTMEMNVTLIAIYYFPYSLISKNQKEHEISSSTTERETTLNRIDNRWNLWIFFAGMGCVIRPTNAIVYIPLFLYQLYCEKHRLRYFTSLFAYIIFWIAVSVRIDSLMYGRLTIVILNFLEFNIVKNLAHLYGTQPWHWYFTQGFPVILLSYFPFYIWINYFNKEIRAKYFKLNLVILFPIVLYSFQTHKEFRFIYPILPLCFISIAEYCYQKLHEQKNRVSVFNMMLVFAICIQTVAVIYLGRVHQNGPHQVMDYLRMEYYKEKAKYMNVSGADHNPFSVHLLMPCHHTPGYAFLHHHLFSPSNGIQLYHLDCSPFDGNNTQADQFYRDPVNFTINQSKTIQSADYVVMYDTMSKTLKPVLENEFSLTKQAFHMHNFMLHDSRMGQHMDIWKKNQR